MFFKVGLILTSLISFVIGKQIGLTVETKYGSLRGNESKSAWTERPFLQFKGIPYAQAPTGELRFQMSKIIEPWDGVRDATEYGSICPQINVFNASIILGNENCLFLNVFVPKIEEPGKLPVLVFIHGGSFQYESGSDYDPSHWMEENMIVVTFNFRISVFGFLKSPENQVYGNMGMKDQVLALRWVKENVESFNGDPNRVTIMGVNSGAVSVHLHMLSPMSKGLFHQAISQSGTALDPWGLPHKDRTSSIGKMLKCNKTIEITECLRNLTAEQIIIIQSTFNDWFIDPLVPVGPIVESTEEGESDAPENRFLTESPYKLLTEGNFNAVPWIVGVNSEEGLMHSAGILIHVKLTNAKLPSDFRIADIVALGALRRVLDWEWVKAAPITLIYPEMPFNDSKRLSKTIREYYFGNDTFVEEPDLIYDRLTNMYSDRYFFRGAHHSAKLHASQKSPVYLYLFNHKGAQSLTDLSEPIGKNEENTKPSRGVAHYDQIPYFFNTPYFNPITDEKEQKYARNFVAIFARFIIDGKPAGNWKSVPEDAISKGEPLPYNKLGLDPGVVDEPWTDRIEFWDSLIPISEESGKQTKHFDMDEWIAQTIKDDKDKLEQEKLEGMEGGNLDGWISEAMNDMDLLASMASENLDQENSDGLNQANQSPEKENSENENPPKDEL